MADPLLAVEGVTKSYGQATQRGGRSPRRSRPALDGVSLALSRGEILGIVGESGSGKSTLARCITLLERPDRGRVFFDGADLTTLDVGALRRVRRQMQIVFQDPYSSLNPRMSVRDALAEVLRVHRLVAANAVHSRVNELLAMVGLPATAAGQYPADLSGGQRQRVCIARALAAEPRLLIADEAVSALDVSIQAQILNLLLDLQHDLGLALIFISHNLYVVRRIARRIGVMFAGRLIELIPDGMPLDAAQHPYTQALLAAAPRGGRPIGTLERQDADLVPGVPEVGCPYRARCPAAFAPCAAVDPPLTPSREGNLVACHLVTGQLPEP
jgi:oligopeptide transport system ATP-binding protein